MMMTNYREITPPIGRLFAIGDIHGCFQELDLLLNHLTGKLSLTQEDQVVFIGDYIDRGPATKDVIERLISFKKSFPSTIFLRGNHEQLFLQVVTGQNPASQEILIPNGGLQTLLSYGTEIKDDEDISKTIQKFVPEDHLNFIAGTEMYVVIGDYCFAHAGVNPLRDLKVQIESDLLWIRGEFIDNIHYFRKTVIFGHTPFEQILFHLPYKIGIDTGLVFGNMLTLIELREKVVSQIKRGSKEIVESSFPD